MGLDIFLAQISQEEWEKKAAYDAKSEEYHDENGDISDENDKALEAFALELGLSKYGEFEREDIRFDSSTDPKHLFKVGYFRSSYNGSGIDSILTKLFGEDKDIAGIFDYKEGEYYVQPDWEQSRIKAKELLEMFIQEEQKMGF